MYIVLHSKIGLNIIPFLNGGLFSGMVTKRSSIYGAKQKSSNPSLPLLLLTSSQYLQCPAPSHLSFQPETPSRDVRCARACAEVGVRAHFRVASASWERRTQLHQLLRLMTSVGTPHRHTARMYVTLLLNKHFCQNFSSLLFTLLCVVRQYGVLGRRDVIT